MLCQLRFSLLVIISQSFDCSFDETTSAIANSLFCGILVRGEATVRFPRARWRGERSRWRQGSADTVSVRCARSCDSFSTVQPLI